MVISIADAINFKGNNINEGIKEALKGITKAFSVSMLDIDELEPSEDNFYGMRDIEELQESIENFGIQQNLIVMKRDGKKYEIIAGHRRYKACQNLVQAGKEEFQNVPCRILPTMSDTLKNILIIHTNSETRQKTAWEITEEIERLKILYKNYKKENPNFKGDVRNAVVKDTGLSRSVVGRHENIAENLAEPLKEEYKAGKIGVTQADQIASLPQEQQEKANKIIQEKGSIKTSEIKEIKEDLAKLEQEGQSVIPGRKVEATNEHGTYKDEFKKEVQIDIPKKYGILTIRIACDPNDGKYRAGYNYSGKDGGMSCSPSINFKPYQTEQQAISNTIEKLLQIGNGALKQGLKAAGYAKPKPAAITANVQIEPEPEEVPELADSKGAEEVEAPNEQQTIKIRFNMHVDCGGDSSEVFELPSNMSKEEINEALKEWAYDYIDTWWEKE